MRTISVTSKLKSEPALGDDSAEERQWLIAADLEFGLRLRRALQEGKETARGVLATANEGLRFFHPWKANRRGLP
jgi:hypothetical protein